MSYPIPRTPKSDYHLTGVPNLHRSLQRLQHNSSLSIRVAGAINPGWLLPARLSYGAARFCQVGARFWALAARFCRREAAKWACRRVPTQRVFDHPTPSSSSSSSSSQPLSKSSSYFHHSGHVAATYATTNEAW